MRHTMATSLIPNTIRSRDTLWYCMGASGVDICRSKICARSTEYSMVHPFLERGEKAELVDSHEFHLDQRMAPGITSPSP